MKVNIYDTQLNRVLFLDSAFISLLWKPHYNKIGNFTLEVAETDINKSSIKPDYYVSISDDDNLMVIKTVETKNNKIVATGFSATRVLHDVAFIGTIEAGKNVPSAIKSAYETTSGFPLVNIIKSDLDVTYSQQISHKSIGELCEIMCGATDLGFKAVKNGKNINIVFYQPKENPNLVFAEKYGNIKNSSLLISTNTYKNYAIVLGQGEGEQRLKVFVDIRANNEEQKREIIIDAKDLQKAEKETQEQYIKRLEARGIERLLEHQIKKDVNFLPYITQNGVVGEVVTVLLEDFGIKLKTRIISMQIKDQNNSMQKIFDVGELTSYLNVATSSSGTGGGADNGSSNEDVVGIESIVQTTTSTADSGTNIITATLTDGTKTTFSIKNGSKGSTGEKGADGKTPVKGTDYFTEEEKAEFVSEVAEEFAYVTPQMFGAVADGSTDDTKAIQNAFDSLIDGGTIYFPKGKYIVQHSATANGGDYVAVLCEGKQGITVVFENGTTIKHNLTDKGRYTMFRFVDCNDIEIRGGVIEGERNEHPDVVTGYGSKGLHIRNCENVYIHDMEIWNIFGDSIGLSGTTKQCENILVENCTIHNCYRNGIGVGGVKNGIIRNCRIYNISGNSPQAGIDIEAEYGHNNENITVDGCHIHDCVENTIAFSSNSYDLKVRDCLLDGDTQGQTTSDNIEIVNTTITGTVNARNNNVLRNCTVKSLGLYDSADYPNVNVKAYDTVFSGNSTSTSFNFNGINGLATLSLKDCEINHLEGSTHTLFYSYNASNIDVTVDGGKVNLWNNPNLAVPFASGDYKSFKMIGCSVVAKSTTMAKSLLSINASDVQISGCNVDLSEVTSYSPSSIIALTSAVDTLNCHSNTFVTNAVTQFVLDLSTFAGNAYLTNNTAPYVNNFYLTGGGTVFAKANTTKESVEFTADDKYKLDNIERGADGKSAYEIYVDNGGTLSETEWLGSIASVSPIYASSVEEMTDISKVYIGSTGTLWGQIKQETIVNENVFDASKASLKYTLNTDGTIYTNANTIPYCVTDFLAFDGSKASSYTMTYIPDANKTLSQNYSRICFYDAEKNFLKQTNLRSDYTSSSTYFKQNADGSYTLELNKMLNGSALSSSIVSATRYIRMSFFASGTGSGAVATDIDGIEIYFATNAQPVYQYGWADTGIQYAHYAMTDNDYEVIANKVVEKLNA